RAGAVLLATQDDQRNVLCRIVLCRIEDEGLRAPVLSEVAGVAARDVVKQLVAQPDVGERPADHHLVVTAPRTEGVEVLARNSVFLEVLRRRRTRLDAACR